MLWTSPNMTLAVENPNLVYLCHLECFPAIFLALSINRNTCNTPVMLNSGTTTFSSMSSKESSCGTANRPLTIEARAGQKINITLQDFSRDSGDFNIQKINCQRLYGHLVSYDSSDILDICGGTSRQSTVHVSTSHKMQIAFDEAALERFSFLIKVEGKCSSLVICLMLQVHVLDRLMWV